MRITVLIYSENALPVNYLFFMTDYSSSEQVLQRELHDSRIQCRTNLAKLSRVQIRIDHLTGARVYSWPETIQDVVSLGAKFQSLAFPEMEDSRQADVERPGSRTLNTVAADITGRARIRQSESRRVEI